MAGPERYHPGQRILLVGDGNMSFGRALARQLSEQDVAAPRTLVVTSYESRAELLQKYAESTAIVAELQRLGAAVLHGVDASRLGPSLAAAGGGRGPFDRIVFQFPLVPLAASREDHERSLEPITANRMLLHDFLRSCVAAGAGDAMECAAGPDALLAPGGEAHITSKDVKPYLAWRIGKLADDVPGVVLARKVPFDATRYAGYESRKPSNLHPNRVESFPMDQSATFVFARPDSAQAPAAPQPAYYCQLCDVGATSAATLAQHCLGKKHKRHARCDERWRAALAARKRPAGERGEQRPEGEAAEGEAAAKRPRVEPGKSPSPQ